MVKANPDFARTSAVVSDEGGYGADTGPYEHQLADHKRKILAQIGKAFEAQRWKKPEADQLKHLITVKPRIGYRLNLPDSEVRVVN